VIKQTWKKYWPIPNSQHLATSAWPTRVTVRFLYSSAVSTVTSFPETTHVHHQITCTLLCFLNLISFATSRTTLHNSTAHKTESHEIWSRHCYTARRMLAFKVNPVVTFLASCTQMMSAIYRSARVVRGGAGKLIHRPRNLAALTTLCFQSECWMFHFCLFTWRFISLELCACTLLSADKHSFHRTWYHAHIPGSSTQQHLSASRPFSSHRSGESASRG